MIVLSVQSCLIGRAFSARTIVSWRPPRALPWAMLGRAFGAHCRSLYRWFGQEYPNSRHSVGCNLVA
jgi:hypothetical protein